MKSNRPRVEFWAVVILHYASPQQASLLAKSACDFFGKDGVVVVVDNSGDYVSISTENVVRTGDNLGYGAGVNAALESETLETVPWTSLMVVTQDCQVDFDAVVSSFAKITASNDSPVAGGPTLVTASGAPWAFGGRVNILGAAKRNLVPGKRIDWLDGALLLINRPGLDLIGGQFPSCYFLYKEDVELGVRLRNAGARLALLPQKVVQTPSAACHYLEVRNRCLFARRNLSNSRFALSVIWTFFRTLGKVAGTQRAVDLAMDFLHGVRDGWSGDIDPVVTLPGVVRRATLSEYRRSRRGTAK